jgi:hypothetical protein
MPGTFNGNIYGSFINYNFFHHTSYRLANSTALAINPLTTPSLQLSPSSTINLNPHQSIIDTFDQDSYLGTRERHLSSSQTEKRRNNSQQEHSLQKRLCCCFVRPFKKNRNIYRTAKQKKSLEKCQTTRYSHKGEERTVLNAKELYISRKKRNRLNAFRSAFWTLIVMLSVMSGGFFLSNNTSEFLNATVQTTLDGSVPLTEVFFPSVVVCNINQIRKSFFEELGFYDNDTLVRIMYEDFIKGTIETEIAERNGNDPKRTGFHDVRGFISITFTRIDFLLML